MEKSGRNGGTGRGRNGQARGSWSSVRPGTRVETRNGDWIGDVADVGDEAISVVDPLEGRELLIPRAACEPTSISADGGTVVVRLRPGAVRGAGTGPERFVRLGNLDDDWVWEQTGPRRAIVIEDDDPLDARRATEDGLDLLLDEEDLGDDEGSTPQEISPDSDGWAVPDLELVLGGRDRPSAHQLTPSMLPSREGPPAGRRRTRRRAARTPTRGARARRITLDTQWIKVMLARYIARLLRITRFEVWAMLGLLRLGPRLDALLTRRFRATPT